MKVTEKDVAYVAELANLELTADECARMLRDLNSILEYVDRLNTLNTDKVEPMAQVSGRCGASLCSDGSGSDGSSADVSDASRESSGRQNTSDRFAYALRDDIKEGLRKSLPHEVAVRSAPDTDGTFFEVPKVIER